MSLPYPCIHVEHHTDGVVAAGENKQFKVIYFSVNVIVIVSFIPDLSKQSLVCDEDMIKQLSF